MNDLPDYQGGEQATGQADEKETPLDFAAGLQAAREALDGKQMDNGTVGCVEAVTKILSHVHPEFQKMVDDGVVNTVEGENSLHSRLEKMGVEIVPFDESQVAQGDIIFYDDPNSGVTYQHVLVADHQDEDGNWRVYGNSSSNNKVMEQPLYQGQTPAWIAKVSNLKGTAKGTSAQPAGATGGEDTDEGNGTQPVKHANFDDIINNLLREGINANFNKNYDDEGTLNILNEFVKDKNNTATGDAALQMPRFLNADGEFADSRKNRKALEDLFGDDLAKFGQGKLSERMSDLLKRSMQPDFIKSLTDDDKKFFGNILKQKLKDAGIDLKGMITTKQGLEKGDEKTFVNAWQALQDKLNQNKEAAPLISDKTQAVLDEIADRVDALTLSTDENALQQAEDLRTTYKGFTDLEGEINKLRQKIDKIDTTKGTQAAQLNAKVDKATKETTLKQMQADLDTAIENFYNPPQPVKAEQPAPFVPYDNEIKDRINDLNTRIDTEQDEATITKLKNERDALTAVSKSLTDFQNQLDEQKKIMNDDTKSAEDKRNAKETYAGIVSGKKYKDAQANRDELLHPKPAPVKEPEHYEAEGEAKDVVDQLTAEMDALDKADRKGNAAQIKAISDRIDDIQKNSTTSKKPKRISHKKNPNSLKPMAKRRRLIV